MNFTVINGILSDLRRLDRNPNLQKVETISEEDDDYTVYKVKSENNLYVKVLTYSDSYSDNDYVYKAVFVKAKEVQKVEYINID